jgi:hypothetical protein
VRNLKSEALSRGSCLGINDDEPPGRTLFNEIRYTLGSFVLLLLVFVLSGVLGFCVPGCCHFALFF